MREQAVVDGIVIAYRWGEALAIFAGLLFLVIASIAIVGTFLALAWSFLRWVGVRRVSSHYMAHRR